MERVKDGEKGEGLRVGKVERVKDGEKGEGLRVGKGGRVKGGRNGGRIKGGGKVGWGKGGRMGLFVCLMVFNATFNNISVISWRSVLLVEETAGPGEKP